jgi:hypothetical protein
MASKPARPQAARSRSNGRVRNARHRSFMTHAGYRWLKLALLLCLAAILAYALVDQQPRPNGGSWLGYTLGTAGALLILWLSLLGVRKRAMTPGRWSLKSWTSAHVYLGLALVVVATLHCGFQFGWNVHTLAYVLMMLVILSGIYGVAAYLALPRSLSAGREGLTEDQMLEGLRAVDRQLHEAAQPLAQGDARLVEQALREDPLAVSAWRRLSGHYPRCATRDAIDRLAGFRGKPALDRVEALLVRRLSMLERMRQHMRTKALIEVWLYVHIPLTIALFAALAAHIVSVFFYW